MLILGLSAFEHGGAAAVVKDGVPVAAAQEDRYTRKRRDPAFPLRSARACLRLAGATSSDLDLCVFHQKPLRRFERVLAGELGGFPRTGGSFARSMFTWLGDRLWIRGRIADELGVDPDKVGFCEHATAQAAGAFLPSAFDEAAVLFAGHAGEWATTALFAGRGAALESLGEQHHPHSLADLCAAAVSYLGFEPEDAPRTLGELAAHGAPTRREELAALATLDDAGALTLADGVLPPGAGAERVFGPRWEEVLGPARVPAGPLHLGEPDAAHGDLAASVQALVEEALLALARTLAERSGMRDLCLAGELAESPRAVARLVADGPFERVHLQPAAGEGGAALGAALWAAADAGDPRPRGLDERALGEPVLDLDEDGEELATRDARRDAMLAALAAGECVGWVRGRFVLGDPSPGDRVALADPAAEDAVARLRDGVLRMEAHRGLACAVRSERAASLFDLPTGADGALAAGRALAGATDALRAAAPAVVHADGRARPLVVDAARDPELAALLEAFEARGGAPVLACETLAARGEPPVRGAVDAKLLLDRSELDAVVVEDRLLAREP